MAHEILIDLFQNLIAWLEDSVEVGGNKQKESRAQEGMIAAYNECQSYEIEGHGDGWRLRSMFYTTYMDKAKVSKSTAERHFKDYGGSLFKSRKSGGRVFIRKVGDAQ